MSVAISHWAGSRAAKAETAWMLAQGLMLPAPGKLSAPCPRCGKELRAGPDEARAHDRERLVPFVELREDGLAVGFRCRVRG